MGMIEERYAALIRNERETRALLDSIRARHKAASEKFTTMRRVMVSKKQAHIAHMPGLAGPAVEKGR